MKAKPLPTKNGFKVRLSFTIDHHEAETIIQYADSEGINRSKALGLIIRKFCEGDDQ